MTQEKTDTITIKKETIVLSILRSDLVEIKETGDGIVFNLMGGLHLSLTELGMPLEVKRVIFNSVVSFKNVNLTIDLMNYAKPVTISPNK